MNGDKSISATFTLNRHALTIEKSDTSTGTGTVTATGIDCGSDCKETYDYGTIIAITPNSDMGSVFAGWSGCDSVTNNICNVMITGDRTIVATFHLEYTLLVSIEGTGGGRVTSVPSGIECEPTCVSTFVVGTPIRLTAQPDAGSVLALWSGGCTGTEETCDLTMTDYNEVTVQFVPYGTKEYKLKVKKAKKNKGDGTVTSNDGNISCGDTCIHTYFGGTTVTFSATANEGSTFIGWKPTTLNCSGTDPCTITIDKAKTAQAVFVGDYSLKVVNKGKKGGTGTVTSTPIGINCATGSTTDCEDLYGYGETVTLSASADIGSIFVGWAPAKLCPGIGNCVVPMDKKRTIKAVFSGP
jgi:hypothetical protein